jgi:hypothetical protein
MITKLKKRPGPTKGCRTIDERMHESINQYTFEEYATFGVAFVLHNTK